MRHILTRPGLALTVKCRQASGTGGCWEQGTGHSAVGATSRWRVPSLFAFHREHSILPDPSISLDAHKPQSLRLTALHALHAAGASTVPATILQQIPLFLPALASILERRGCNASLTAPPLRHAALTSHAPLRLRLHPSRTEPYPHAQGSEGCPLRSHGQLTQRSLATSNMALEHPRSRAP